MTVLIVVVGISILILIHEFGHFIVAKKMGLLVEEFGFGFPPRIFSKKIGETTYTLNLLPFGGFVKIHGEEPGTPLEGLEKERSFAFQPAWRRAAIILAGVLMNFLLGWFLISLIFFAGTEKAVLISQVLPDSPAAVAGIKAGDKVLGFDNTTAFIEFIEKNRGKSINFTISRSGEEIRMMAVPRLAPDPGLGIALSDAGMEKLPFLASIAEGFKTSISVIASIFSAFASLLFGLLTQGRILVDFVGPIGIFGVANQAGALGFLYLLQLIAVISLNLMVLNVLPFPALDGGRLLFVLIEKIKGSPISPNWERSFNTVGFLLLILLMVAITLRDIVRLF